MSFHDLVGFLNFSLFCLQRGGWWTIEAVIPSGNDQDEPVDYAKSVKADENDKGVLTLPIQCREPDMHRESSDNFMHWDVYSKSGVAYDSRTRCQLPPIRDLGLPGLPRLGDAATASASLRRLNTRLPRHGDSPYGDNTVA